MAQESNPVNGESVPDFRSPGAKAPSATTTEIRSQIEQTRAEMSQTLDAIQARLSPRRLVNDAAQSVKDATVGRVKRLAAKTNGMLGNGNGPAFDAKRMIDAAHAYGVPVVRDVPVAQALRDLEVGEEIPEALYEAVAEILREIWATEQR